MSKKDKLLERFLKVPPNKDLTFDELQTLLFGFGYEKIEGSGSAVKFYNKEKDSLINLHKPHPSNILKSILLNRYKSS